MVFVLYGENFTNKYSCLHVYTLMSVFGSLYEIGLKGTFLFSHQHMPDTAGGLLKSLIYHQPHFHWHKLDQAKTRRHKKKGNTDYYIIQKFANFNYCKNFVHVTKLFLHKNY